MAQVYNPSTWEAEQDNLNFRVSLGSIKTCLPKILSDISDHLGDSWTPVFLKNLHNSIFPKDSKIIHESLTM